MSDYKYLVTFDADKIHDYVFATGRLKEIEGASWIVDRFTEDVVKELAGECEGDIIYAAGGAGKVRFKDCSKAKEFVKKIQSNYRQHTVASSLTAKEYLYNNCFKKTLNEAERLLRMKKDDKREKWQLTNHPLVEFCNSCGQYPVVGIDDNRHLCRSCIEKRAKADKLRNEIKEIINTKDTGLGSIGIYGFWKAYLAQLNSEQWQEWYGFKFKDKYEIDDLGKTSKPENYIALIYTDGNSIGQHLKSLKSEEEYRIFSKALSEGTKLSIAKSVAKHLGEPIDGNAPFLPVLVGGDDVIILTAAHKALPIAVDFCNYFNSEIINQIKNNPNGKLSDEGKNKLCENVEDISSSAGVVIAHSSHPIISMLERADELLKSAKRLNSDKNGAIDFIITTSPTLKTINEIRNDEYTFDDGTTKVSCTAKPYKTGDLSDLLNEIKNFKKEGFPKNKLNAFYSAMFHTQIQASFESLLIRSRLAKSEREQFNNFLCKFRMLEHFPYKQSESMGVKKESILVDMIEIYDFIQ